MRRAASCAPRRFRPATHTQESDTRPYSPHRTPPHPTPPSLNHGHAHPPLPQVIAAVEETGIPYTVLTVPFPSSTPYATIVGAMAETGILVGATDASLFAAAYMPAHSVLIEMVPAGTRRTTFRYLAEAKVSARAGLGLCFRVLSWWRRWWGGVCGARCCRVRCGNGRGRWVLATR